MLGVETTTAFDYGQRFDTLVSASSKGAAMDIAAEALPVGCSVVYVEITDMALREGIDSWQVAIWFDGSHRIVPSGSAD